MPKLLGGASSVSEYFKQKAINSEQQDLLAFGGQKREFCYLNPSEHWAYRKSESVYFFLKYGILAGIAFCVAFLLVIQMSSYGVQTASGIYMWDELWWLQWMFTIEVYRLLFLADVRSSIGLVVAIILVVSFYTAFLPVRRTVGKSAQKISTLILRLTYPVILFYIMSFFMKWWSLFPHSRPITLRFGRHMRFYYGNFYHGIHLGDMFHIRSGTLTVILFVAIIAVTTFFASRELKQMGREREGFLGRVKRFHINKLTPISIGLTVITGEDVSRGHVDICYKDISKTIYASETSICVTTKCGKTYTIPDNFPAKTIREINYFMNRQTTEAEKL